MTRDMLAASGNLLSKEGKWNPDRHIEALMDMEGISEKEPGPSYP